MGAGITVAIVIRCAGDGRRCKRQLGVAEEVRRRGPTSPVLKVSNQGWPTDHGYPLLEEAVPPDFTGSTGVCSICPKHGTLISERSAPTSSVPGLPGGRWARGQSVQMPFGFLQSAYEAFLRDRRAQTIFWSPGALPTVYIGPR
jgi:hypothetical protein